MGVMVVEEEEEEVEEVGRARVSQAAAPLPIHTGSGHKKRSPGVRTAGVIVTDALPFVGLKAQEKGERAVEVEEEGDSMYPASVLITEAGVSPLTVTLALAPPAAMGEGVGCTT